MFETEKGIKYRVQGHKDLNDFAQGVLALVNLKSQVNNTVIDIHTYGNSNEIDVTVFAESDYKMDKYIESYLGKIAWKEDVEIVFLNRHNLKMEDQKQLGKIQDKYLDEDGNDFHVLFEEY